MLWAQSTTKENIRAEHKLYYNSKLNIISQVIILSQVMFFLAYLYARALNTGTCIRQGDLFYSAGLHRNYVLATANTGQNRETFWQKCRSMDRKGRSKHGKKSLAVNVACMTMYWPTPGFKGRTFTLCVLTRWDFNFCVRSSPLRGAAENGTYIMSYV